ncbi:hypothetical protein MNEG_10783 [Monoraphidium neglectum]|uniref:Aminotransferase class V domain-containing protein n=1 Tax=Monoraphidium neglectum TaxID=145388 RepID=A0A0D2M7V8_9CHLO|nr:hypothetical protein MNEG_10783 [Monoraphidium neglectum]KIY97181.1 hypothetical protein MNEG_10783 [Monoraphidium neglectum]|eukprot:XP_013896201.1 hypothetical protein MNEG_10783 [Monoraphidium neglectum]
MAADMSSIDGCTTELEAVRHDARGAFAYFSAPRLAFMENAGGSQVPRCVADAVRDHLLHDCAQLGAGYDVSNRSTSTVDAAHDAVAALMGAPPGSGHVALGPSSSQLLAALGGCYSRLLGPGDEVVVQESCHEANAGPWVRCAESSGATLRWWRTDVTPSFSSGGSGGGGGSAADNATSASSDAAAAAAGGRLWVSFPCASRPGRLAALLSERTRVVAVTHVSNLLGGVADLRALVATNA